MCAVHHGEQHTIGEPSFEHKYVVDLIGRAVWFASNTRLIEIREHARNVRQ